MVAPPAGERSGQLALPFARDPDSLRRFIEGHCGRRVALALTDNARSIFSLRLRAMERQVRLHRMFLEAPEDVLRELAEYIRLGRGKTPLFWRFVRARAGELKRAEPRRAHLRPRGRHHDLTPLFRELNEEYFGGRLRCGVTWGRRSPRRGVRCRTLGSYSPHTDTVRVSPHLDRKSVPAYFIRYILYHEMLHADMGVLKRKGRRLLHSPEFKARERLFPHYGRALAWEKKNL